MVTSLKFQICQDFKSAILNKRFQLNSKISHQLLNFKIVCNLHITTGSFSFFLGSLGEASETDLMEQSIVKNSNTLGTYSH